MMFILQMDFYTYILSLSKKSYTHEFTSFLHIKNRSNKKNKIHWLCGVSCLPIRSTGQFLAAYWGEARICKAGSEHSAKCQHGWGHAAVTRSALCLPTCHSSDTPSPTHSRTVPLSLTFPPSTGYRKTKPGIWELQPHLSFWVPELKWNLQIGVPPSNLLTRLFHCFGGYIPILTQIPDIKSQ